MKCHYSDIEAYYVVAKLFSAFVNYLISSTNILLFIYKICYVIYFLVLT